MQAQGQELEILETVRGKVPPEVFTTPYSNPVGGNPETVAANLREGMRVLKDAGYEVRNQKQVNTKTGVADGQTSPAQTADPARSVLPRSYKRFFIVAPASTREALYWSMRIGCAIGISTSSLPHGRNPCRRAMSSATHPGSPAADTAGSRNYVGIKNPAVDALIERVIFAKDRAELVAAHARR